MEEFAFSDIIKKVRSLMHVEMKCILRNQDDLNAPDRCDRDCLRCDLVQKDTDLLIAYTIVIWLLEKTQHEGMAGMIQTHFSEDQKQELYCRLKERFSTDALKQFIELKIE